MDTAASRPPCLLKPPLQAARITEKDSFVGRREQQPARHKFDARAAVGAALVGRALLVYIVCSSHLQPLHHQPRLLVHANPPWSSNEVLQRNMNVNDNLTVFDMNDKRCFMEHTNLADHSGRPYASRMVGKAK